MLYLYCLTLWLVFTYYWRTLHRDYVIYLEPRLRIKDWRFMRFLKFVDKQYISRRGIQYVILISSRYLLVVIEYNLREHTLFKYQNSKYWLFIHFVIILTLSNLVLMPILIAFLVFSLVLRKSYRVQSLQSIYIV